MQEVGFRQMCAVSHAWQVATAVSGKAAIAGAIHAGVDQSRMITANQA